MLTELNWKKDERIQMQLQIVPKGSYVEKFGDIASDVGTFALVMILEQLSRGISFVKFYGFILVICLLLILFFLFKARELLYENKTFIQNSV